MVETHLVCHLSVHVKESKRFHLAKRFWIFQDVWGFSLDDESNSGSNPWKLASQCSSSDESRVELPSLSSSLPFTDSNSELQAIGQHLPETNSSSPTSRKVDNVEQDWPEDLRVAAASPKTGVNEDEVIVISDTESEGEEELETADVSTIAKMNTRSKESMGPAVLVEGQLRGWINMNTTTAIISRREMRLHMLNGFPDTIGHSFLLVFVANRTCFVYRVNPVF